MMMMMMMMPLIKYSKLMLHYYYKRQSTSISQQQLLHHHHLLLLLLLLLLHSPISSATAIKRSYIVYLGAHPSSHSPRAGSSTNNINFAAHQLHTNFLASFLSSKAEANDSIIYSYTNNINAFAALLDEHVASTLARDPRVVSVFLNRGSHLHTTHSWDFLMLEKNGVTLPQSLWDRARFGEDVIIANLDSGVWPEAKSFSDNDFGTIPAKWNGVCQNDTDSDFSCNRKLVGARYFHKGYSSSTGSNPLNSTMIFSPRDTDGHGTHTLSTAGGNFVQGANINGVGNGTAKGGAPRARVAAYKVCWPPVNDIECSDADILKAFEMAIHDGVDVLSVSLGGDPIDYFDDAQAIGAFHAVKNGIVVVSSAGNDGPQDGTVTNVAPWIITVGASTIDREFQAFVQLHSGRRIKGLSLSEPLAVENFYPLINSTQAKAANASTEDANLCMEGTLDPKKVEGKILVCMRGKNARIDKGVQAALAGAVGMILCNDKASGDEIISDPHVLPATHITYTDGLAVYAYINSTAHPMAFITKPVSQVDTHPAPFMASFSSKGPNTVTPGILKPDITAPGVNIVAAFSEAEETGVDLPFNVMSGTSMSCPHVSGVVGLLRAIHPDWSPAAIKSALMTTARTRDNTVNPMLNGSYVKATPFSYGAGHIRPNRAADPGLVYDLSIGDYVDFLCGAGYNKTMIEKIVEAGSNYECPKNYSLVNFNYPSITVPKLNGSVRVTRTLKNVGSAGVYAARVRSPRGTLVTVKPLTLKFEDVGEEKSFELTIKVKKNRCKVVSQQEDYTFGGLSWSDGKHYVRSPIVVSVAA